MPKQEITLKFNFSYGELLTQSDEKSTYLNRDAAVLTPRGITPDRITAFDDLQTVFTNVPEDGTMQSLVSIAVQKRDDARTEIMLKVRDVVGVAALALGGTSSPEYRTFMYGDINELEPSAFHFRVDTICDRAVVYQTQLEAKGITADNITEIRSLLPNYKNLIKEVDLAKGNRDIVTEQRRIAANNLYEEMAAMCEIAKVYYQDRDEAHYNDYIIYSSSKTAQTRTGRLLANESKTRTWEALTPETDFICENESDGDIEIYFSQTVNGTPATVFATLSSFQKSTHNIAEALGYNLETNAIHFVLKNKSSNEVIYRIRVE